MQRAMSEVRKVCPKLELTFFFLLRQNDQCFEKEVLQFLSKLVGACCVISTSIRESSGCAKIKESESQDAENVAMDV